MRTVLWSGVAARAAGPRVVDRRYGIVTVPARPAYAMGVRVAAAESTNIPNRIRTIPRIRNSYRLLARHGPYRGTGQWMSTTSTGQLVRFLAIAGDPMGGLALW
jgi:hypothetical protein